MRLYRLGRNILIFSWESLVRSVNITVEPYTVSWRWTCDTVMFAGQWARHDKYPLHRFIDDLAVMTHLHILGGFLFLACLTTTHIVRNIRSDAWPVKYRRYTKEGLGDTQVRP
jgi:hypothetical protein